jgi:urea transport system ATP-binding protein
MSLCDRSLCVYNLHKEFGGLRVLRGVDLELHCGEVLAIIGANGSGKSTLFRLIGGWLLPDSGSISLESNEISQWTVRARFAAGLREVPQFPRLSHELTVREHLALGFFGPNVWRHLFRRASVDETPKVVGELSEFLALENELDELVGDLPFGSRKMAAIAAAVAGSGRVVLLDEPTVGLDAEQRERLAFYIGARRGETSFLIIEHDLSFLVKVCDRILEVRDGRLGVAKAFEFAIQNEKAI